ncbi:MAG: hypothetical protein A3Q59_01860 [Methanomethylophilus alvi]|nr:MAG: hypothetical protein A3Q59_01860 [Methanomethylophilus alvi]
MTEGVLGVIACPMLEDELLWALRNDREQKTVCLADNEHCASVRKKMDYWHIPYTMVAESDVWNGSFPKGGYTVVIVMNDLALHAQPKDLQAKIEGQVRLMSAHVDSIACYYALCGNYGWDISEFARKNGLKPTAVFRDSTGRVCDDCVGVAVDGGARYLELEKTYKGMFYVIPAIAHNWKAFMGASDEAQKVLSIDKEILKELGITDEESYMRWLFEVGHYENYLIMDTGLEPNEEQFYEDLAAMEKSIRLKPITIAGGWLSLKPSETIYRTAKAAIGGD